MTTPRHLRTLLVGAATCAVAGFGFFACYSNTGNTDLASGDAASKVYRLDVAAADTGLRRVEIAAAGGELLSNTARQRGHAARHGD